MALEMTDVIVVGAGIFGQVITKALRAQGRSVIMIDNQREEAGSKPAACIMKPSWFSSMGKDVYEPSLKLLDELYGVQDIKLNLRPMKVGGKIGSATVHWIPPMEILGEPFCEDKVTGVSPGHVHFMGGQTWSARLVVVAAGIWTEKLLPQYKQQGQKGMSLLWPKMKIEEPFVHPYAPYRQFVAFNRGDGVWAGDGTAIKQENWTLDREYSIVSRAEGYLIPLGFEPRDMQVLTGVRPYSKSHKPCLVEQVNLGLWVASGGAKNGTVAAGYCAHRISTETS